MTTTPKMHQATLNESDQKHVFTCAMDVRWGDMDAFGHVNNTVYFRYVEQARIEWMESAASKAGLDRALLSDTHPVIGNAQCSFLYPIKYPDKIEVKMFIGTKGRSSFETYYQIIRLDKNRTLCAEGTAKVVWVDATTGKSIALPPHVIAQFEA